MTGAEFSAPPLIVLHGANGAAEEMAPLLDRLRTSRRDVVALDLLGHAGRPIPATFKLPDIAEDLVAQCDAKGITAAHWFGFSVGGLIALWLAVNYAPRVLSVSALTAKFIYDAAGVAHAAHLTDPDRVRRADPRRAERLGELHAPQNWEELIRALQQMFLGFAQEAPLTTAELGRVRQPVLSLGGMSDPLVPPGEVRRLADLVQNGTPALFPGSAHPLTTAPLDTIARTVLRFVDDPSRFARAARVSLHDYRWDR